MKDLDHMWKLLQTVMQSTFLEASAEAAQQEAEAGGEDADMADA